MGEQSDTLNDQQRAAIATTEGPILVVAGAGTGKTRVIVERIMRLIGQGIPPEHILALTFTEKAAGEMRDRVSASSLSASLDTTISTYNGFGSDLLNYYGSEWGLGKLRLLGETGQLVFLREHFDELDLEYFAPLSNPDGQLGKLRDYVSLLKQQLITPEAYGQYADELAVADEADALNKKRHQELAHFYHIYLNLCRTHQVIDYDDQIYLSIELLKARPNVLRALQQRHQYILVDEFQDTNPMQSALINLLAGQTQNLMVVGDDDQSIYGWRGATLANILGFTHQYPNAREITLIENYRSTQKILDVAYRLIQHNNPERLEVINKLDKRLHAQTKDGTAPSVRHFYSLDAELTWLSDDIAKRLQAGQDPASIAVLARRTQVVSKIHESLDVHSIPHAMAGLTNDLYAQPTVRQLLEALRTVADPSDNMALFHTLSGPLFQLPQNTLSEFAATVRREHTSLHECINTSESEAFQAASQTIASWRSASAESTVGDLAYAIITDSGWKQQLYNQVSNDESEIALQIQALSTFFTTLKEFERIATVPSVQSYLANLPVLQAEGSDFEDASLDISESLVNVLSVHRSKGLEWETVYIVDCTEGSFPTYNHGGPLEVPNELRSIQSQADEHMAEERRLMYVATTRARRELLLSYSSRHGNGAPRRPSRFLNELFDGVPEEIRTEAEQTGLELFAPRLRQSAVTVPPSILTENTFTLNVSQIACWLDCPQDFYYKYVLGVPLPSSPNQQYGTMIHTLIQSIFDGRQAGKVPTLESSLEQVRANLPTAGYTSAGTRERAHAQAMKSAEAIYMRFISEPLPSKVEQSFRVTVPNTQLTITGRIDAVYQLEKGVEIRDFKTSSSVTTPEQAKARATTSTQLTLYALAWQLMHDELPALVTLDFVETGQTGSVKKQMKSLDTMRTKLEDMITNIKSGNYPPGKDHTYCKHP